MIEMPFLQSLKKNDYMDELMDGSTPAKLDWPCEVPEPAGKVQEVG